MQLQDIFRWAPSQHYVCVVYLTDLFHSYFLYFSCLPAASLLTVALVWRQAQKHVFEKKAAALTRKGVVINVKKIHGSLGVKFSPLELATTGEAQQQTYRGE